MYLWAVKQVAGQLAFWQYRMHNIPSPTVSDLGLDSSPAAVNGWTRCTFVNYTVNCLNIFSQVFSLFIPLCQGENISCKLDKVCLFCMQKPSSKSDQLMRIAGDFKEILKPYYSSGKITKEEYKEVMRKAVPQVTLYICKTLFHWT